MKCGLCGEPLNVGGQTIYFEVEVANKKMRVCKTCNNVLEKIRINLPKKKFQVTFEFHVDALNYDDAMKIANRIATRGDIACSIGVEPA